MMQKMNRRVAMQGVVLAGAGYWLGTALLKQSLLARMKN